MQYFLQYFVPFSRSLFLKPNMKEEGYTVVIIDISNLSYH